MHPRILVLDEPTSALDPTAAEDVLATLTRLVHDLGVSVVLAEHRLERVVPFADTLVVLDGRGGLRSGAPADLLTDSPVAPPLVELGRAAGWHPLPLTVRDARRRADGLRERLGTPPADDGGVDDRRWAGGSRHHGHPRFDAGGARRLDQAPARHRHRADGAQRLGQVLVAVGPAGQRQAACRHGDASTAATLRRSTTPSAVPSSAWSRRPPPTCSTSRPWPTSSPPAAPRPPQLERLVPGIDGDTHPRDLSEGQRLALALTIVLAGAPPVLLLDEPTRGLDYAAKHALAEILRGMAGHQGDGRAVLIATHDVEFVAQVAGHVVVLAEGEVVSSGPVRRVVAESPAFAPQVTKVLGAPWLRVDEVVARL